ncbi:MAG: hypothetical protein ACYDEX_26305 [Mobilitalea sp.]
MDISNIKLSQGTSMLDNKNVSDELKDFLLKTMARHKSEAIRKYSKKVNGKYGLFGCGRLEYMKSIKKRFLHKENIEGFKNFEEWLNNGIIESGKYNNLFELGFYEFALSHFDGSQKHIFIESSELCEVLTNMDIKHIPSLDDMIAIRLIENTEIAETLEREESYTSCAVIHKGINNEAFALILITGNSKKSEIKRNKAAIYLMTIDITDSQSAVKVIPFDEEFGLPVYKNIGDNEIEKEKSKRNLNLAINLAFYLRAFPECVRDGVPFNEPMKYIEKNGIIVKITKSFLDEKGIISPHIRKGHFRKLMSERFTNKKGQVIYIKETIVRGKAHTIEELKNDI